MAIIDFARPVAGDRSRARADARLAHEGYHRQLVRLQNSLVPLVSVIVPVLDDVRSLEGALESVGDDSRVETIVVNAGEPTPATIALEHAAPHVRWLTSLPGRGRQMNVGAREARGDWLLFLHADTRLPAGWVDELAGAGRRSSVAGGSFRFQLDSGRRLARVLERGVKARVRWLDLPYGDQALFVRRDVFARIRRLPGAAPDGRRRVRAPPAAEGPASPFDPAGSDVRAPVGNRRVDSAQRRKRDARAPVPGRSVPELARRPLRARRARRGARASRLRGTRWLIALRSGSWLVPRPTIAARHAWCERSESTMAPICDGRFSWTRSKRFSKPVSPIESCCSQRDGAGSEIAGLGADVANVIPQRGETLSQRLEHGFADLFARGYNAAALIGSDLPTLPASHVEQGIEALLRHFRSARPGPRRRRRLLPHWASSASPGVVPGGAVEHGQRARHDACDRRRCGLVGRADSLLVRHRHGLRPGAGPEARGRLYRHHRAPLAICARGPLDADRLRRRYSARRNRLSGKAGRSRSAGGPSCRHK